MTIGVPMGVISPTRRGHPGGDRGRSRRIDPSAIERVILMTDRTSPADLDVIVIGAGFAGIYGIHRLRDQMGLTVRVFDPAEDVAASWYWNRCPGARVDVDRIHYSYAFGPDAQQGWFWSERFPSQPEIVAYLEHVADKLDAHRDMSFGTRVVSATWDDATDVWHVVTDDGRTTSARFLVSGGGLMSEPVPGITCVGGQTVRTDFADCTGPLLDLDITGRDGLRLADAWADGPRTHLGLTVAGFPNLFLVTGPQSLSVLFNMPLAIEDHIDLIGDTIRHMCQGSHTVVEPTHEAQEQWVTEVDAIADRTPAPNFATSWHLGSYAAGSRSRSLVFLGGVAHYRTICGNVRRENFRTFHFADTSRRLERVNGVPVLDPSVAVIAQALRESGFTGFRAAGVEGTRDVIASVTGLQAAPQMIASVREMAYGDDPEQRLRVYSPGGSGPLPVLVYLHGGGFVAGGLDIAAEPARDLAVRTGAIVVAVTHRRAPEHRFPAAHDDAYAALRWTRNHIGAHGGDPARIGVAGDSSGGNLAAAAALRAVQDGIELSALVLVSPLVDPAIATKSREEFARKHVLELDDIAWFTQQYASSTADVTNPRLAIDTADLAGLPPTLVITNECDVLRDEAELLVERMRLAGVDVTLERFDGLAHGVFWMSGAVPRCADQRQAAANFLVARLGSRVGAMV